MNDRGTRLEVMSTTKLRYTPFACLLAGVYCVFSRDLDLEMDLYRHLGRVDSYRWFSTLHCNYSTVFIGLDTTGQIQRIVHWFFLSRGEPG